MAWLKNADGSLAVGSAELATYYASAQVSGPSGGGPGGTNKAMLSLLNPASSGKTFRLFLVEYFTIASSGTNVYIDVQIRRITAHSAGTAVTPSKRDTGDGATVAEVKSEPSVTGGAVADMIQQLAIQSNSPATGDAYRFRFGDGPGEKPIVLKEGEGIVIHQVTSNGGTFCPGLIWTEG